MIVSLNLLRFGNPACTAGPLLTTLLVVATPAWADRADDIVMSEMSAQHIRGLALAVTEDGKMLRFSGYGESNLESKAPVTSETVFAIASVSKQFLATGIIITNAGPCDPEPILWQVASLWLPGVDAEKDAAE